MTQQIVNVAARLAVVAEQMPDDVAVVEPLRYHSGRRQYGQVSFRELDEDSNRIAGGLRELGVSAGTRLALLVRPSIDFISLVFALYKAGVVVILIDPGMGRKNLVKCLSDAEPEGFVAIPPVHAVRLVMRRRFPKARYNVTVGRRWFWGGATLDQLRKGQSGEFNITPTASDDPAAIIFTTGSTGPPKGVLYRHGNFDAQVEQIRDFYGIEPGGVDLPGFPLFGLFNCAMGMTTVIPDMDPTRPALVDPKKIIEAVEDWQVTQTFGSPAIWNRVGTYCNEHGVKLKTIRRVLSAGAAVPAKVLQMMRNCIHPDGEIHTPYGATESLPVASIASREVLGDDTSATDTVRTDPLETIRGEAETVRDNVDALTKEPDAEVERKTLARSSEEPTVEQTMRGAGVCVGRKFPRIEWKVVRIVDGPIATIDTIEELPAGEIGELIVRGPVVTREYCTRVESNAMGKIADGDTVWHRMGDSGYLDNENRFWFCGRVAHRVLTAEGPMYPVRCEAIFNRHPAIFRSALVGVGEPNNQRPVIILEKEEGASGNIADDKLLRDLPQIAAQNPLTVPIADYLFHPAFPVDIRHNAKIFREKLSVWAAGKIFGP